MLKIKEPMMAQHEALDELALKIQILMDFKCLTDL
jgi:hypothetical protein